MNTTAPNRFAGLLAADYNAQIANGQLLRDAQIADYDNLIKVDGDIVTISRKGEIRSQLILELNKYMKRTGFEMHLKQLTAY